jgi:pimeloyl-ACP methyl ester carboxylesterase
MAALTSKTIVLPRGPLGRPAEIEVVRGGSEPALVWLHGMTPPSTDDPFLQALAQRFGVWAPVMPGLADPSQLDPLVSLHDLVLFYDAVLDGLGLSETILAGHGFGGMLAAELAAHHPGRCTALVLVSPLGLWNDAHPVEDLFARPHEEVDELIWRGADARPGPEHTAATDPVEVMIAQASALGTMAKYLWPIPDRGLDRRLYRISAPTLLMFGQKDAFVPPAYARDFAACLPDSRDQALAGSHMAIYERPAEAAQAISAFAAASGG